MIHAGLKFMAWGGEKREEPDVTSNLVFKGRGQWVFENFYFPTPSDPRGVNLLNALKTLREAREQWSGKGKRQ